MTSQNISLTLDPDENQNGIGITTGMTSPTEFLTSEVTSDAFEGSGETTSAFAFSSIALDTTTEMTTIQNSTVTKGHSFPSIETTTTFVSDLSSMIDLDTTTMSVFSNTTTNFEKSVTPTNLILEVTSDSQVIEAHTTPDAIGFDNTTFISLSPFSSSTDAMLDNKTSTLIFSNYSSSSESTTKSLIYNATQIENLYTSDVTIYSAANSTTTEKSDSSSSAIISSTMNASTLQTNIESSTLPDDEINTQNSSTTEAYLTTSLANITGSISTSSTTQTIADTTTSQVQISFVPSSATSTAALSTSSVDTSIEDTTTLLSTTQNIVPASTSQDQSTLSISSIPSTVLTPEVEITNSPANTTEVSTRINFSTNQNNFDATTLKDLPPTVLPTTEAEQITFSVTTTSASSAILFSTAKNNIDTTMPEDHQSSPVYSTSSTVPTRTQVVTTPSANPTTESTTLSTTIPSVTTATTLTCPLSSAPTNNKNIEPVPQNQILSLNQVYFFTCQSGFIQTPANISLASTCQSDGLMSDLNGSCETEIVVIQKITEVVSSIETTIQTFIPASIIPTVEDESLVVKKEPPSDLTELTMVSLVQQIQSAVVDIATITNEEVTSKREEALMQVTNLLMAYSSPVSQLDLSQNVIPDVTYDKQNLSVSNAEALLTSVETVVSQVRTTTTNILKGIESAMSLVRTDTSIETKSFTLSVVSVNAQGFFQSAWKPRQARLGGISKRSVSHCDNWDGILRPVDQSVNVSDKNLRNDFCTKSRSTKLSVIYTSNGTFYAGTNDTEETNRVLSDEIILLRLCGSDIKKLDEPAQFSMFFKKCELEQLNILTKIVEISKTSVIEDIEYNPCVYLNTTEKRWRNDGVSLTAIYETNDPQHGVLYEIQCRTEHFTAFGVNFPKDKQVSFQLTYSHTLRLIDMIFSSISVVLTGFTLFIITIDYESRLKRKEQPHRRILYNLMMSLFLLNLCFLSAQFIPEHSVYTKTGEVGCVAATVITNYPIILMFAFGSYLIYYLIAEVNKQLNFVKDGAKSTFVKINGWTIATTWFSSCGFLVAVVMGIGFTKGLYHNYAVLLPSLPGEKNFMCWFDGIGWWIGYFTPFIVFSISGLLYLIIVSYFILRFPKQFKLIPSWLLTDMTWTAIFSSSLIVAWIFAIWTILDSSVVIAFTWTFVILKFLSGLLFVVLFYSRRIYSIFKMLHEHGKKGYTMIAKGHITPLPSTQQKSQPKITRSVTIHQNFGKRSDTFNSINIDRDNTNTSIRDTDIFSVGSLGDTDLDMF